MGLGLAAFELCMEIQGCSFCVSVTPTGLGCSEIQLKIIKTKLRALLSPGPKRQAPLSCHHHALASPEPPRHPLAYTELLKNSLLWKFPLGCFHFGAVLHTVPIHTPMQAFPSLLTFSFLLGWIPGSRVTGLCSNSNHF